MKHTWRCPTCGTQVAVLGEHVTATCSHRNTGHRLWPVARMVRAEPLDLYPEEAAT